MDPQFKYLLLLQEYDIRSRQQLKTLRNLEEEMGRLDERIQKNFEDLSQGRIQLRRHEEESRDLEFQQQRLEARQKLLQGKLDNAIFLSHEPALQKECDSLKEKEEDLENRQLTILFEIDRRQKEIEEKSRAHENLKITCDQRKSAIGKQKNEIQQQLQDAENQGQILRENIDGTLLKLYDFTKKSVAFPPFLAPISSAVCSACRMKLAKNFLTDLLQNPMKVAACDFCRRLLYVDEKLLEETDHGEE